MREIFGVPGIRSEEDFPVLQKLVVWPIRTIADFHLAENSGPEVEMVVRLGKSLQLFDQNIPALRVQPNLKFALSV
jgi:hypothetical protein